MTAERGAEETRERIGNGKATCGGFLHRTSFPSHGRRDKHLACRWWWWWGTKDIQGRNLAGRSLARSTAKKKQNFPHVKEETGDPGLQIVLKPEGEFYLTHTMHLHVQGTSLPSKKLKKQSGPAQLHFRRT